MFGCASWSHPATGAPWQAVMVDVLTILITSASGSDRAKARSFELTGRSVHTGHSRSDAARPALPAGLGRPVEAASPQATGEDRNSKACELPGGVECVR